MKRTITITYEVLFNYDDEFGDVENCSGFIAFVCWFIWSCYVLVWSMLFLTLFYYFAKWTSKHGFCYAIARTCRTLKIVLLVLKLWIAGFILSIDNRPFCDEQYRRLSLESSNERKMSNK